MFWKSSTVRILALGLCLSTWVGSPGVTAEEKTTPVPITLENALQALKYRSVGPFQGGRVSRVTGVAGNPNLYYLASASGGVWQSTDGGFNWKPIFDEQPTSSIGSIAVAPSDTQVIYVGSGEANIRGNVAQGNGIYKSTDGGKTWQHVWKQDGQIGTMVVDPKNPNLAFAAVLGKPFGPNPERGVYRTQDGGKTWVQVLKKDIDTGASDVALDPNNPKVVFAGFWQARRSPWDLTSGGPGSGLYVSRDGGDTWQQLTGKGLPPGIWGKVGVAVAPSDSKRVYALIEAEAGGLFRSDDGGETWTRANGSRALRQRAWYYTTMTINPQKADEVWFPQVPMLKTSDGGKTIKYIEGIHHGDHHDLWIDPTRPQRMISANDGGVDITLDGGKHWYAPPLPLGQFYHVATDNRVPYSVAGAMQDLGTAQGPNDNLARGGIREGDWYRVGGGEAGHVVSQPDDPNIVYAGEYLGYISRYDHRTRQIRNVSAYPENPSGHGAGDFTYRFQWTAPIATSPHNPKTVYHGANVLFKTTNGGQSWQVISPDLTRNDKTKQQWAGGPITGDNTGVEFYCTIFAIAESPKQAGLIWVGSDDGLVHLTQNGGKTWENVTAKMPGFPEWGTVSIIEPSPFSAGTAYVVVDAHRRDDMRPYLYKTSDYGQTWVRLDSKLPQDVYLHSVREDPQQPGLLYLGTERGVMYSPDGGTTWRKLQLNLPTVAVHDLVVKGNDLVLATHGRGIWILDDLTAVRNLSAKLLGETVYLFPVDETTRWRYRGGRKGQGQNPPRGAQIYYYLKTAAKEEITLEILDPQGTIVRTLSSKPAPKYFDNDGDEEEDEDEDEKDKGDLPTEAGVQRAVWDLAYQGAEKILKGKIDSGDPGEGPLAVPGSYTVRLKVGGKTVTQPLVLKPDPRVNIPSADLIAQRDFILQIRDDITQLTRTVNKLRTLRDQLQTRLTTVKGDPKQGELLPLVQGLLSKVDTLEAKLHNPKAEVVYDILAMRGGTKLYSRLSPLMAWADEGDGAPTVGLQEVYKEQKRELNQYLTEFQALLNQDLPALNSTAQKLGVAPLVEKTR